MEREVVKSLAPELRMETNTEVDTDRISDVKHKGLQYTVNLEKQPGKRSHKLSGWGRTP